MTTIIADPMFIKAEVAYRMEQFGISERADHRERQSWRLHRRPTRHPRHRSMQPSHA